MNEKIFFRADADLKGPLVAEALADKRTESDIIRILLREALEARGWKYDGTKLVGTKPTAGVRHG
jgi:hypothetical protein